jgi:cold shock CspA family protein
LTPSVGRVTFFDARRGLGTVADSVGLEFDFHATALVDGSRRIEPGTPVTFSVAPGHRGRYEARHVSTVGEPPAAAAVHQSPA